MAVIQGFLDAIPAWAVLVMYVFSLVRFLSWKWRGRWWSMVLCVLCILGALVELLRMAGA